MNSTSIIHTRRPMSRFVPGGIAILAAVFTIAASTWQPASAVARLDSVSAASASQAASSAVDPSVPAASTVFAGLDFDGPGFDAPTF